MKFVSWNVNGIRAWYKKGHFSWFETAKPDFFCIQETKADESQIPGEVKYPVGYTSFWNSSKMRKGWSGVGILAKHPPLKVYLELGETDLDAEGRFIALEYKDFVLINCYFPNGGQGPHRIEFKLRFYDKFLDFCEKQVKKGKNVIFCGDVNTAHNEIDLARPKENVKNTGFLPIERAWLDKVLNNGFVDVFRKTYPETVKYTYWDMKTFARERNVGWRIDYFFVNKKFFSKIKKIEIMDDVFGSDHCPILLEI